MNNLLSIKIALLWFFLLWQTALLAKLPSYTGPIIDTHIHASPEVSETILTAKSQILAQMDRQNVVMSVVSIPVASFLSDWQPTAKHKLLVGPSFPCTDGKYPRMNPCFAANNGWPDLQWLEDEIKQGRVTVFGELLYVYYGISPADERLLPYYQLAEKYSIPIAVHAAHGPPKRGRVEGCCPDFNQAMGNPLLLKPVLLKFPKLKIWLLHGGEIDFHQQAIELMLKFETVYAEMSIVNSIMPQALHQKMLKGFLDSGLEDRIMFGSDNMPIDRILERMDEINILTAKQRQKILYDNAVKFFELN
ncbi:amidohydrolase family protein [uncultured Paraglaciecola sp.]|uniref:amidohydrolase family protein n=1 Tax=uncultured Paraglaciecola sp. TaxID=1765024 RepID=UPI0030D714E4